MSTASNALLLKKIIEKTHDLLKLYYSKQHWRHIRPLIAQLSEAYIKLYQSNPLSLNAQLQLFIKDHGYATNLVVNQTVITLAVCKQFKYSDKVTTELVSASLCNYLCVANECNTLARGEALTPQASKQWQFRHHLAVKLLSNGNQSGSEVSHILMRLNKYQKALCYPELINLYDLKTIIVALADLIAKQITPKNSKSSTIGLKDCLAKFYLQSESEKVAGVIKGLVKELSYPFTGQFTKFKGYNAFCLSHEKNTTELVVLNNNKQVQRVKTKQILQFRDSALSLSDPTLIYGIWFNKNQSNVTDIANNISDVIQTAIALGKHEFVSYQQIEKTLGSNPIMVERLLLAASQYNKQQQRAGALRHSLTMVGLDNASLMCQRVLLEQSLDEYAHPLMVEVLSRYETTKKVINAFVAHQSIYHFEEITGPFTAYIYYLLSTYQDIKWAIPVLDFEAQLTPLSYASIFGVNDVNNQEVCQAIQTHFAFSAPHKAFIASEKNDKNKQVGLASVMIFIKITTYFLLKPEVPFSAWQKNLINEQIKQLGLPDFSSFIEQILSQGPFNPI